MVRASCGVWWKGLIKIKSKIKIKIKIKRLRFMPELKLPLDFERLPEFWQLTERLRQERVKAGPSNTNIEHQTSNIERELRETAVLLWVRLWVVLGYLARSTNRPGWLNEAGARQVNAAFDQFGEDETPVEMMVGSLLKIQPPRPSPPGEGEAGYMCDLFAALKADLAGD